MHTSTSSTLNVGLIILFIFAQLATFGEAGSPDNQLNNVTAAGGKREEKFLSLFSIVRFPNSVCIGTNSYNGTCLTSAECASYGGNSSGTCASGFGVCCVLTYALCGATINLNNSYWQNPGYSSAYTTAGQCSVFVNKASSDITQLRLDFVSFTLAQPDTTAATAGQCSTDSFTVTSAANPVPAICGINTYFHMYIDFAPGVSSTTFNIITSGTSTSRYWNIRISQIPGGQSYTAPDNCLQWYPDATGTVQSFNYQGAATPAVQHLAYQDYTICIRTNQGFCGVKYTKCATPVYSWGVSGKDDNTAATTTVLDASCAYDFLQIPCASDQMNSIVTAAGATVGCASKICGVFFSADATATASVSLYSYRRPFELRFYTDYYEGTVVLESFGFCLSYSQQPCLSATTGSG